MVDSDARQFIQDLVIAFPVVDDIAKFNSPDIAATHRSWARVLSECTKDECYAILNDWIDGKEQPPSAIDCKMIAHAIRSMIHRRRDKQRKRDESHKIRETGRNPRKRTCDGERIAFSCIKGNMREAFEKLVPLHRRMLAGEISQSDYDDIKTSVLGEI